MAEVTPVTPIVWALSLRLARPRSGAAHAIRTLLPFTALRPRLASQPELGAGGVASLLPWLAPSGGLPAVAIDISLSVGPAAAVPVAAQGQPAARQSELPAASLSTTERLPERTPLNPALLGVLGARSRDSGDVGHQGAPATPHGEPSAAREAGPPAMAHLPERTPLNPALLGVLGVHSQAVQVAFVNQSPRHQPPGGALMPFQALRPLKLPGDPTEAQSSPERRAARTDSLLPTRHLDSTAVIASPPSPARGRGGQGVRAINPSPLTPFEQPALPVSAGRLSSLIAVVEQIVRREVVATVRAQVAPLDREVRTLVQAPPPRPSLEQLTGDEVVRAIAHKLRDLAHEDRFRSGFLR